MAADPERARILARLAEIAEVLREARSEDLRVFLAELAVEQYAALEALDEAGGRRTPRRRRRGR